jgi:DNA-binding transcriptional LysR family regulator
MQGRKAVYAGEPSGHPHFQLRFLSKIFLYSGVSSANVDPSNSIRSETFIDRHASAWHWVDGSDRRSDIRKLAGYQHRLVASADYLARNGVPHSPEDLKSHACLRYRFPTSGKLDIWPLVENGVSQHPELPQSAIANTIDSLYAMAEAGIGIALLPDFIVENSISSGKLQTVLDDNIQDHRNVCVLWPASRQQLPKIKAFVDFIVSRLGSSKALM